jgi:hypothetical protein
MSIYLVIRRWGWKSAKLDRPCVYTTQFSLSPL